MKSVHFCIVALSCAVLALAEPEPEPAGARGNGFGGQQREVGGNGGFGGSSYSQPQKQQQSLPYGANTQFGNQGFGGNNGGRFVRSPEPPVFGGGNGGFGGSSYSQPQKQQQSLPYGANTQFGNQGFGGNNGGRFVRSPEPPVFEGGNGGFGGSSYSQPQKQQQSLPYGANTQFGNQRISGNNGGRFARSPEPPVFGGGNGGFGGSSYSQPQKQQQSLPYGANIQFGNQGFGGNNGGRFVRSPEPPVFEGGNGGFGGSSYSQPQKQQQSLPYGANTQFGNQRFSGNNGGRFARSPEPPVFGGGNGGFGGSSYSQPQKQQQSLPYGANTQFGNKGFGSNNGGRFARSPEPPVFGGGNGGFGGSSYSQPQKQQQSLQYGANTQFGNQGFGGNNDGRFVRSPEPPVFGGGNGGFSGSSYSQPQKQQQRLPYGANTQFGNQRFGGNNGGRFARSPEPPVFGVGNGGFGGSSYSQPQKQQQSLPYGVNTQFGNQGFGGNNGERFVRSPEPQSFGGNGKFGGNEGLKSSSYSQRQQQPSGLPYGANTQSGGQGFGRS